jgi:hypothetical protein
MGNEKDLHEGDEPAGTGDGSAEDEAVPEGARTIIDERRGPPRNGGGKAKKLVRKIKNYIN